MTPPTPAQNNSAAASFDTDVLILGAGPVGLTLANLLGGYGVSTVLADAGDKLIDYPRGVGLDDESLRTFQTAGVVSQVLPHTTKSTNRRWSSVPTRPVISRSSTSPRQKVTSVEVSRVCRYSAPIAIKSVISSSGTSAVSTS